MKGLLPVFLVLTNATVSQYHCDMNVASQLKEKGIRVTSSRTQLIEILSHTQEPITVKEILEKITGADRATVYRELSFLKKENIIREVSFGEGKSRFEIQGDDCHHHLVCEKCGSVQEVKLNESAILKQIPKSAHFKLTRHAIEFFGLCAGCN
jgi:Fe2+ or Zn2+ uptake regulation protein